MVLVKGPLFSIEASGKLGSLVYGRNQYGQWVSEPEPYEYIISPEQAQWRYAFYWLMRAWGELPSMTDEKRNMWNEWALNHPVRNRLGQEKFLTGRHWFCKLNYYRKRAGIGPHLTPPLHASCAIFPVITISQEDWGIICNIDITLTGDDLLFFSTVKNQKITRNFMPHNTEFIRYYNSSSTFPTVLVPNTDLQAVERRYFFKYCAVDGSGRRSPHQIEFFDCIKRTASTNVIVNYDAYLNSSQPDTNYSSSTSLTVRFFTINRIDSVLYFDLSDFASYSICTSAILYVKTSYYVAPVSVDCYPILFEWENTEVTWNSRKTGIPWSAGGLAAGVDCSTDPIGTFSINAVNTWFQIDITAWLNSCFDGSAINYGLLLANFLTDCFTNFYSRNSSTTDCPFIQIFW